FSDATGAFHSFILDGSTFTQIDFPEAIGTGAAADINDRGNIVGHYRSTAGGPQHGYLRTADGHFSTVDFPGAADNKGRGINRGGEIVGRYDNADGTYHGYLRSIDGDFTSIDVPGALQTEAYRINDAGDVVGVYIDADGKTHGFLMKQ